ncbi:MAG TPA: hypothetical protein VFU88_12860 [Ktedonobacterales bacterium]|nr:hypothetical protein [Ktedonobacterales bacterium]
MPYYPPTVLDAGLPFPQATPPMPIVYERADPPKWEYRLVTIDPREDEPLDETALAALGAEGWLLVGILQHPAGERAHLLYHFVRAA